MGRSPQRSGSWGDSQCSHLDYSKVQKRQKWRSHACIRQEAVGRGVQGSWQQTSCRQSTPIGHLRGTAHSTQQQLAWLEERTGQVSVNLSIQGCIVGVCKTTTGKIAPVHCEQGRRAWGGQAGAQARGKQGTEHERTGAARSARADTCAHLQIRVQMGGQRHWRRLWPWFQAFCGKIGRWRRRWVHLLGPEGPGEIRH
jgi:hypothetical protein